MHLFVPSLKPFQELYISKLRDLYNGELQLLEALPKMTDAATSAALQTIFGLHLEETRGHVRRLEQIFHAMQEEPAREICPAMQVMISESEDRMKAGSDAALAASAQQIEQYEIAEYGITRALALRLGEKVPALLLHYSMNEEDATDKKLFRFAETAVELPIQTTG